jgi:ribbon-helix-helix CopG family protein
MTTIPESVHRLLLGLKEKTGRPRSELIAAAIRAYAKKVK